MTVIYTGAINGNDTGNTGYTLRNVVAITGNAQGQVRCTFQGSGSAAFSTNNCSIGISTGTNADTTATPVELLFSGRSGFAIGANSQITSDWANLSGFTSSNLLVVIIDMAATNGNDGFNASIVGATGYYHAATASYNNATTPAGSGSLSQFVWALNEIDVQAAAVTPSIVPLNQITTNIGRDMFIGY